MKRKKLYIGIISMLLPFIVSILLFGATKSLAAGTDNVSVTLTEYYDEAYEVLNLVNAERSAAGLSKLSMDQDLLDAAMLRAAEITVSFSHTRPNNQTCFTASTKMNGENIAYGYDSASSVMNGWMNSTGHRENILRSSFKIIGIGCIKVNGTLYWVQCFGNSSTAAPATNLGVVNKTVLVSTGANSLVATPTTTKKVTLTPTKKVTLTPTKKVTLTPTKPATSTPTKPATNTPTPSIADTVTATPSPTKLQTFAPTITSAYLSPTESVATPSSEAPLSENVSPTSGMVPSKEPTITPEGTKVPEQYDKNEEYTENDVTGVSLFLPTANDNSEKKSISSLDNWIKYSTIGVWVLVIILAFVMILHGRNNKAK